MDKMKAFVIWEKEGWEITGIDKLFLSHRAAYEYVFKNFRDAYKIKSVSYSEWCHTLIHEIEIEIGD